MSDPIRTYVTLYLYVSRLAAKAILHRAAYLLFAPAVMLILSLVSPVISRLLPGMLGGFALGFLQALGLSAILFAGRAIVEQRRLDGDDVQGAPFAFLSDVMSVLFVLWIGSMLLGSIVPALPLFILAGFVLVPVLETVAFAAASGYGVFPAAWSFFQRDWAAWIAGQVPAVLLVALYFGTGAAVGLVPTHVLPPFLATLAGHVLGHLPAVFLLAALVYRGVLYLTLDSLSPRRRAEKFGGAPTAF